jgi:tryptophan halogenase
MDKPPSPRHRLVPFRETGRVLRVPNEPFAENTRIQVMLRVRAISTSVERTVAQLPARQAYVEPYCNAPAARAMPG